MATPGQPDGSPTTSIQRVLVTMVTGMLLAVVVDAGAVVHASAGMPDGPVRTVTHSIGTTALQFAEATHLNWPSRQLTAILGRPTQPSTPPLLAAANSPATASGGTSSADDPPPEATPPAATDTPASAPAATATPLPRPSAAPAAGTQATQEPATPTAAPPPPTRTATSAPTAAPTATAEAPLRRPMPNQPLRLLVTGDSLTGYLGPQLIDAAASDGPVHGVVDTHDGTGLVRPDFVDWSVVAKQQVATDKPEAVVVMLGGNDDQNIAMPDGKVFMMGSPEWTQEYARRAERCLRIWIQGGARRVYWLSVPPPRDHTTARVDAQINVAIQQAAGKVPGAEYLDLNDSVTAHGQYADFVTDGRGATVLVREPDGIHLNIAGSNMVAQKVLHVIERDWHLDGDVATTGPSATKGSSR
mgnify:CR=1 FL=1